jgi:hypothetical protein
MSNDGRVIAKHPGVNLGDEPNETAVWAEMMGRYTRELSLVVQEGVNNFV